MTQPENSGEPSVGRNEPCPCGSGKKYKRCHGANSAPKLSAPHTPAWPPADLDRSAMEAAGPPAGGIPGGLPPGFDPSQMDPAMFAQMAQALQRLPKGQLQRLQSLMQKAMAGRDVSREAAELERSLPPDFQNMMAGFKMPGADASPSIEATPEPPSEMSVQEARRIVEEAAAAGKIKQEEAAGLLDGTPSESSRDSGFSKLWRGLKGKK